MYRIFLQNKYTSLYFKIINNSRNRMICGYSENHHILPKALGGNDNKSNIAILTAREHFLCHYILCKMLKPKSKEFYSMVKAFNMMKTESITHNKNRYFNSKLYETFKKYLSEAMSLSQKGRGNSQFGTCWVHNFDDNLKEIPVKIKLNELEHYLKNGYFRGRTNKTKFKEIKFVRKLIKTMPKPIKEIRCNKKMKIFHPVLCDIVIIREKFVYDYIIDGWLIIPKSTHKGTTKLTKNKINIKLFLDIHINMFMNKGWSRGFYNPNHKGTSGKTYVWTNGKKIFN